ncbi:hypothetical protein DRO60_03850 [Candidatus Bathyarchaeota archaeon]|nr:MAG: hypothetical protein DRO60_03850 [Candidatus Bathyarchaeota archaeon]
MAGRERPDKALKARFGLNELGEPIDATVERFLELLLRKSPYRLRAFVVFGSRARGDWRPWSDTDVLLVMEGVEGKVVWGAMHELGLSWADFKGLPPAGLQARVFTPDGFRDALRAFSLTALDALEEGIVLYDDGFWRDVKAEFEEMKRRGIVKKTSFGWEVRG